jgi:hypothetical protein
LEGARNVICQRRGDNFGVIFNVSPSEEDHWREDGTCSYCGSLNPETLLKRIEAGEFKLGPTDKSYKVYVDVIAGEDVHRQVTVSKKFWAEYQKRDYVKVEQHPTREDDLIVTEVFNTHLKFYFQHFLNDDGTQNKDMCIKFIELYNNKTMKIGYPGHFYVSPFFMKKEPRASAN